MNTLYLFQKDFFKNKIRSRPIRTMSFPFITSTMWATNCYSLELRKSLSLLRLMTSFLFGLNYCIAGWTHRGKGTSPILVLQPSALSHFLFFRIQILLKVPRWNFYKVTCIGYEPFILELQAKDVRTKWADYFWISPARHLISEFVSEGISGLH
jgi:hypothetical protein